MSSPSGTANSIKTSNSSITLYPTYYPIPSTSPPPSPSPPSSPTVAPPRPKPLQLSVTPKHNRARSKSHMPITPLLTDFTPSYCSFASFPETADTNGVYGPSMSVQPPRTKGRSWEWRPWEWELDGKWSLGGRVLGALVAAVVACSLVVTWIIVDRHKFRHV